MGTRLLAGLALAACTGVAWPSSITAQGGAQAPAVPLYPTEPQMKQSPEAQQHVAKAMAIARPDLVVQAENACHFMGPQRPALERQASGQQAAARRRMEPVKLFDNLYYMGFSDIGAWAITTSDGIILLDTLNSPQEADEIMVGDMLKLGLDPGLFGDEIGWMEAIRKNPAGANPFVYGEARFARYIDIMTECARARIAAMRYKAAS